MRILVDTNTLFSAFLKEGNEKQLIDKAISGFHTLVLTDFVEEETERLFPRKLSRKRAKRARKALPKQYERLF